MRLTEVIYISKNKQCLSLKPIHILVMTEDVTIAMEESLVELKQTTEHWERYSPVCGYREAIEVK